MGAALMSETRSSLRKFMTSLGAKDCTPEINTSEIIVDFRWHFPMDFQWRCSTELHFWDFWCNILPWEPQRVGAAGAPLDDRQQAQAEAVQDVARARRGQQRRGVGALLLRGTKGVPRKGVWASVNTRVWICKELNAKHDQTGCYLRPPFLGTPLVPSRLLRRDHQHQQRQLLARELERA